MTTADESGRSWLKYGCFGCLGILGLGVLIVATVGVLAWHQASSMQNESQVLTQTVPAPAGPRGLSAQEVASDLPGSADRLLGNDRPGRVILDFSQGEFHVQPAAPGEQLRVEASYDPDYYELAERFEQGETEGWAYTVSFRKTRSSGLIGMLSEIFSGRSPDVRVYLPADVLIALELDVTKGGTQADLGGLWLSSADLSYKMGGLEVSFDEPLRAPADHLSIRGSMGGASLRSIGNASPRRLDVEFSMGGLDLDLGGRWLEDSEIGINASMGGGEIRLPRDVAIEGLEEQGKNRKPHGDGPTLKFSVRQETGEVEFHD